MQHKTPSLIRSILLCLVSLLILALPVPSFADSTAWKVGGKLIRGVANISTGWIEIFRGIYEVTMEKDPITGLLYGPIRGSGMAIIRTGSGAYETATFLLPVPEGYRTTINPEFVWEDWKGLGGLEAFIIHQDPTVP